MSVMSNKATLSKHSYGTLICICGVLALTPDALLLRCLRRLPNFDVLFIKFSLFTCTFTAYHVLNTGSEWISGFYKLGKIGLCAGFIWGISNVMFTLAIQLSYVSNVLVILATNPAWSAILSWIFLKEAIPYRTMATCFVSFGAILLVFSDSLVSKEAQSTATVVGNILALLSSITFSVYFVMLRFAASVDGEEPDMAPCNIISGITVMIVSLGFGGRPSTPTTMEGVYFFLNGVISQPTAFLLLTIGPTYVPASELSLLCLIETVLSPVWVWLAGFEKPPPMTVYGGIILCVALIINSFIGIREEKQRPNVQQHVDTVYIAASEDEDKVGEAAVAAHALASTACEEAGGGDRTQKQDEEVEEQKDEEEEKMMITITSS